MFIIRKQDKKTGNRVTVKEKFNTEEEATKAIKSILTEYEYYKTILMKNQGQLASNGYYSTYYYYHIIEI